MFLLQRYATLPDGIKGSRRVLEVYAFCCFFFKAPSISSILNREEQAFVFQIQKREIKVACAAAAVSV